MAGALSCGRELRFDRYASWGGEGVWDCRAPSNGRIMSGSVRVSEGISVASALSLLSFSRSLSLIAGAPGAWQSVQRVEVREKERHKIQAQPGVDQSLYVPLDHT